MSEGLALAAASLPQVTLTRVDGAAVEVPRYRRQMTQRICHIGVGRFHRAHQANYLHRLLQMGAAEGWGLCGISLRAADRAVMQPLAAQDHLYSLWEMDGATRRVSVIGSLMQQVDASADSSGAVAVMGEAATRIISLTVTESGYCLDAGGELNLAHPDIVHDLTQPALLRSAPGLIVRALAARRAQGSGACTLQSCDNLIDNGQQLRRSVLGFATRIDAQLASWIEREISFPSSMVDRITPVADPALTGALCAQWGVRDDALVNCEAWQQWIIGDHFVAGRPPYEQAGAVLSSQVKAYEKMKVGMLNGGHSALSHLGLLTGQVLVHEAMADPLLRRWLAGYMDEVAATLEPIVGVDYADYRNSLIQRFGNPAIEDRLLRLAQDTSAKYLQALLPPLLKRLERGLPAEHLACAMALWMHFLGTPGAARDAYQDGAKERLMALTGDAQKFLAECLPLPPQHAAHFCASVNRHLQGLRDAGSRAHVAALGQ